MHGLSALFALSQRAPAPFVCRLPRDPFDMPSHGQEIISPGDLRLSGSVVTYAP